MPPSWHPYLYPKCKDPQAEYFAEFEDLFWLYDGWDEAAHAIEIKASVLADRRAREFPGYTRLGALVLGAINEYECRRMERFDEEAERVNNLLRGTTVALSLLLSILPFPVGSFVWQKGT